MENRIPKEKNNYNNTLDDFALIDNKLAAAQADIGESSNLAQICLSYSFNFGGNKITDYCCILAVLAQCAIDNAKRAFDVSISDEIKRIKKDINVKENGYPYFWRYVNPGFNRDRINPDLDCPMNDLCRAKLPRNTNRVEPLPMTVFFKQYAYTKVPRVAKKVNDLIAAYSLSYFKSGEASDFGDNDDHLLLRNNFDALIEEIRSCNLTDKYLPLMSWLINRAFAITPGAKRGKNNITVKIDKNRALLLKILYEVNPECLLKCFSNNVKPQ